MFSFLHLYLSCPTKSRRSPACCSDFVRQSLSDKSHTAESNLQRFCPTKFVLQKSCCSSSRFSFLSDSTKKGREASAPHPSRLITIQFLRTAQRLQPSNTISDSNTGTDNGDSSGYHNTQNLEQVTLNAGNSSLHDSGNIERCNCTSFRKSSNS